MGATTTLTTKSGVQVFESGYGAYRRVQVRFRSHLIVGFDAAGVIGGVREKLFTLSAGVILFLGATVNITGTVSGGDGSTTGVFTTFTGDAFGLGSVIADNTATLATTEQDYLNTSTTTAAVAGVATVQKAAGSTESAKVFDGSTGVGAKDVHLNWLITDSTHNINGAAGSGLLIDGAIHFHYVMLGDKGATL